MPASPEVRDDLVALVKRDCIWLGKQGPLTREGVLQIYRRLFRKAGISGPKAGPHALRNTFGINYIRAGGEVHQLYAILEE